ncbi:MAG: polyphosphate kinase 2 [Gammaproteobacteria bacterium]|nr:polyphosphate kinase 2 [Gammaproteobacteria bacterium]
MGKKDRSKRAKRDAKKDEDNRDLAGDIMGKKAYEAELFKLQLELVKMQAWIKQEGLRVVVVFEGRDAAGKGGVIKRILEHLSPRICRTVALPAPTERERSQWYFQRYVAQLPAAGEMVLFDRSWYNRAGVEPVMGFCTEPEREEFLRTCPDFENMLIGSGIILVKYWFMVSQQEQEKRFQARLEEPHKRWKLSPMDLEARSKWADYSEARDIMFERTDTQHSPWYVVDANVKRHARLNCIRHLLGKIPYEDVTPGRLELTPHEPDTSHTEPSKFEKNFVPSYYP